MTMSAEGVAARARDDDKNGAGANGHAEGDAADGAGASHPAAAPAHKSWTIEDAANLYSIQRWGQGYFSVNPEGHVAVHPDQDPLRAIDLKKLVDECRERDIQVPLLIRFTDILKHRVGKLAGAFDTAIREHDYKGQYRCVYPIKVNQQRHVIEEILEFGKAHGFGL